MQCLPNGQQSRARYDPSPFRTSDYSTNTSHFTPRTNSVYQHCSRGQSPPSGCNTDPPPLIDPYGNSCLSGWYTTGGIGYSYDAVGNRLDHSGSYTSGNRITAFNGCSYTTDADGDVTSRACGAQVDSFTWSAESRLVGMKVGSLAIALDYDAGGRLVRKDTSGVNQRYYLWDGGNLLAELGSGATSKVAEYSWYGTDVLHATILGTTPYYGQQDAVGNTVELNDTFLERAYGYDGWGELTSSQDVLPFSGADRSRWKGALYLGNEADLYYMRNRWYEPKSGRFLSEDPFGLAGGVNLYAFGADDPVNLRDPSGACLIQFPGDNGPATVDWPDDLPPCAGAGGPGPYFDWWLANAGNELAGLPPIPGEFDVPSGGPSSRSRNSQPGKLFAAFARGLQCGASALSFSANLVTSGLVLLGGGEIALGVLGLEIAGFTGATLGALGASVETESAIASATGLVLRGGAHVAQGALPGVVTGAGVLGDLETHHLSWKSLVPIVGLPSAYEAVAVSCAR